MITSTWFFLCDDLKRNRIDGKIIFQTVQQVFDEESEHYTNHSVVHFVLRIDEGDSLDSFPYFLVLMRLEEPAGLLVHRHPGLWKGREVSSCLAGTMCAWAGRIGIPGVTGDPHPPQEGGGLHLAHIQLTHHVDITAPDITLH